MKSKFVSLVALIALFFATQNSLKARTAPLFGSNNVNISTVDKTLKVNVKNIAAETVSILLEDTEGVVLVNETIESAPNFVKAYRLDNLPAGKYQFTVKRNGHKVVQPFDITAVGINLSLYNREETLLPSLIQKENKVLVQSFVSKGDKTTVRIFNNEGALLLEKEYAEEVLRKSFDLSNLTKGVYFFEVQTKADAEYFTVVR